MRRLVMIAAAAMTLLAVPLLPAHQASASCASPTVTFKPAKVARGGTLTISGQFFGDDCLDTGTLPPGVGALGAPLTGLVIVISQGANEFTVATGSADSDYSFQVDVVVPAGLEPGEATLNLVGAGDARMTISPPLVISSAATPDSADATVATFGPPLPPDTDAGSIPPPVLPAEIPDEPVATPPPLSTTPVERDSDTTGRQRAIGVAIAGVVAIGATGFAIAARAKRRS